MVSDHLRVLNAHVQPFILAEYSPWEQFLKLNNRLILPHPTSSSSLLFFFAVNFMITIAMLPSDVCSFASIYINDAADVAPMSLHYAMHSMHAPPQLSLDPPYFHNTVDWLGL